MKILFANKFFYIKGGAETVFFATAELTKKKGHQNSFFSMKADRNFPTEFSEYFVSNAAYDSRDMGHQIHNAFKILYSFEAKHNLDRLIRHTKPEMVHLHNIYHQISPSILHTIRKYRLPVVMTLHDFKIVCGSYSMLSSGKPCEDCRGGRYYSCLFNKCVKDSTLKSFVTTIEMYLHHRCLHLYDLVNVYIAPSRFLLHKIRAMGFKGHVVHLPNFIHADEYAPCFGFKDRSICCVGRLSNEKGLLTLIDAVKGLDVSLKIIGEGPLKEDIARKLKHEGIRNVHLSGYKRGQDLKEEIQRCMFMVLASECYENNPTSILEAFALGKPVIGSRIGGIPELVKDYETGLTFESGNAKDLRLKIGQLADDPDSIERMGRNARELVEEEFGPEKHYKALMRIYQMASARAYD